MAQHERKTDPVNKFFLNAVHEFNRMVERSEHKGHPWAHDNVAAGMILVTAYVYSPRWELCSIDLLSPARVHLIQNCVATAYVDTPEVHGNLPEHVLDADEVQHPMLDEFDWWDEVLEKAEAFVARRNERRASQPQQRRNQPRSVPARAGNGWQGKKRQRSKPSQKPAVEEQKSLDEQVHDAFGADANPDAAALLRAVFVESAN